MSTYNIDEPHVVSKYNATLGNMMLVEANQLYDVRNDQIIKLIFHEYYVLFYLQRKKIELCRFSRYLWN